MSQRVYHVHPDSHPDVRITVGEYEPGEQLAHVDLGLWSHDTYVGPPEELVRLLEEAVHEIRGTLLLDRLTAESGRGEGL